MRIAVAGATGRIGSLTRDCLERDGHQVVGLSRSLGVDLTTGAGLDEALLGVDAVIDVTSTPATETAECVEFFDSVTRHLLAAGERAGVRHHVLLSIAGLDRVRGNGHQVGKRHQEMLLADGPLPWTIVPATQFHDFAEMVVGWTESDGVAALAPLLVQPIAPGDVAEILAEIAVGPAQGRYPDIAGPEPQDLVDMARRTLQARGRSVRLVPTWTGIFSADMAGSVLLPGEDARIAPTTFDDWLVDLAGSAGSANAQASGATEREEARS